MPMMPWHRQLTGSAPAGRRQRVDGDGLQQREVISGDGVFLAGGLDGPVQDP
jgi:hypothetical protein